MKKSTEETLGLLIMLLYPLISGFSVAVAIYFDGLCVKSLVMLTAWLASLCILWSMPAILQKFGRKKEVMQDERDIVILKNAAFVAHAASWLYFLLACLVIFWMVGPGGSVSANLLPVIFVGGVIIYQFVLVLGSLIQEKKGHVHG